MTRGQHDVVIVDDLEVPEPTEHNRAVVREFLAKNPEVRDTLAKHVVHAGTVLAREEKKEPKL